MHQTVCANFSLATDSYIYGYASRENITEFSRILERITPVIDFQFFCTRFAAYYFCNYGFIPCDVTTGAPRAICAESCNYLHDHCSGTYLQVVTLGGVFGQTIKDNCENTLSHIQEDYGFPCSSSSLQNECIDLLSTYICKSVYSCNLTILVILVILHSCYRNVWYSYDYNYNVC